MNKEVFNSFYTAPNRSDHKLAPSVIDEANQAESKCILTQEEGLRTLYRFLIGEADFDSLKIIRFDLSGGKYQYEKGHYRFYIGDRVENTKGTRSRYMFNVNTARYLGHEPEQLFAVPRRAEVGQRPYYWLEFTEKITEDSNFPSFYSLRLTPDHPTRKTDSLHWNGLEEQLLVDFIKGENGIKFTDLIPFRITRTSLSYALGRLRNLSLYFENIHSKNGDQLLIVPNTDPQNIYTWIDIFREQSEGKDSIKIITYRILQDQKKIYSQGWRNPETQYLVDFLDGNPQIIFDNLRPVRVKLGRKSEIYFGKGKDKEYYIGIGTAADLGVDEIVLIPKQDPKGLYQWVEAYKFDPETGEPVGEAVTSVRLIQGIGFVNEGWYGCGIQSLIDFVNKERKFEDLLPITVKVKKSLQTVALWRNIQKKEHVYIVLSRKFNLRFGDIVELFPDGEENDIVIYKLFKGQVELGIYGFNKNTKKFEAIEIHDSLPRIDRITGEYVDENKVKWINAQSLGKKFGRNLYKLLKDFDSIPTMPARGRGNKIVKLFNEEIAIKVLEQIGVGTQNKVISSDQANEELMRFLEVKDE